MGAHQDPDIPATEWPVAFFITGAGLRALGREVPPEIPDDQAVNQHFLLALFDGCFRPRVSAS